MRRSDVERVLADAGWTMDGEPERDGWGIFHVTVDPPDSMSINGDCRGCSCSGLRPGVSSLWDDVARRVREESPLLEPCPDPGNCDYHGEMGL